MKKPKAPRLVTVAVVTTITIIFWIFYSVYITLTHRPAVDVPAELLEDINPVLDTRTLDNLPEKLFFEQSDVTDFATKNAQITIVPVPSTTLPKVTPVNVRNISEPSVTPEQ
jgi:hypothetical protein